MKTLISLAASLAVGAFAFAGTNTLNYAILSLKDGSNLRGELRSESFNVETIFCKSLNLPAEIIKSIGFVDDKNNAKITLVNGDVLNVDIKDGDIKIDSFVGSLSVPMPKVNGVSISQRQSLKVLKPGNEYCIIDLSTGRGTTFPVCFTSEIPSGDDIKLTKMVLKRIEPGSFMMCNQAKVNLSKPYYIGIYEVTQSQYELITGSRIAEWGSVKKETGTEKAAAFHLSYNNLRGAGLGSRWPTSSDVDEESFVGLLRKGTGLKAIDLPTEAQWEYACRAGTTSLYNNGGNTPSDLNRLGRYGGNRKDGKSDGRFWVDVGSYAPNAWGLYDMHGNVFEWCLDWQWPLHDCTDPVGADNGRNRCLRGGSVDYRADECTQDFRYYINGYPSNDSNYYGARICLTVEK